MSLTAGLTSGELGRLLSISATVWQDWGPITVGTWRQAPALSGGGFLFDTGAHMLNTVVDLAGEEFAEVTAWLDDNSGEIAKKYGMRTTPHLFVIDPKGTLVYQGAIDDRPTAEGNPRTARNYVREAVQKALAGEKVLVSQTKPYGCGVKYDGVETARWEGRRPEKLPHSRQRD